MDLSIIIPCHNEADNIARLSELLLPVLDSLAERYSLELLLIDDGSRDDSPALLEALATSNPRVFVYSHASNKGLGAALRLGFSKANGDFLITTDCDNSYRFDLIPAMLAHVTQRTDVITASPLHPKGSVSGAPRGRLLLSKGCSAVYRRLLDTSLYTYTSLFRVYRREVLEQISFRADDFLACPEILVRAIRAGFRVEEFPCAYQARVLGKSKIKILRTIAGHLSLQREVLSNSIPDSSAREKLQ